MSKGARNRRIKRYAAQVAPEIHVSPKTTARRLRRVLKWNGKRNTKYTPGVSQIKNPVSLRKTEGGSCNGN